MTTFTQEAEQAFNEASTACDRALATNDQMHKLDNMNAAIQDIAFGLLNLSRGLGRPTSKSSRWNRRSNSSNIAEAASWVGEAANPSSEGPDPSPRGGSGLEASPHCATRADLAPIVACRHRKGVILTR